MQSRATSIVQVARDNPIPVFMVGMALGWLAYRMANAAPPRRPPTWPDYALSGQVGVYDPTDEESHQLGAPDADDGRLERLHRWLARKYRQRVLGAV